MTAPLPIKAGARAPDTSCINVHVSWHARRVPVIWKKLPLHVLLHTQPIQITSLQRRLL
jgi:hypothetical protein